MNYTKKSFSVASPGTKTYAENWERTFGRCQSVTGFSVSIGGVLFENVQCVRPRGHTGDHSITIERDHIVTIELP